MTQTILVTIGPTGEVTVSVEGVAGPACQALTRPLEARPGRHPRGHADRGVLPDGRAERPACSSGFGLTAPSDLVYDDALRGLLALGPAAIRRASHVEPTPDGRWTADLGPMEGPVLGPFETRAAALDAERAWLVRGIVVAFFCQSCMYLLDMYDLKNSQTWAELFFSLLFAVGFVCIGIGLVTYAVPEFGVEGTMYYLTILFVAIFPPVLADRVRHLPDSSRPPRRTSW